MSKAAKEYAEKACPLLEVDPYSPQNEVNSVDSINEKIKLVRVMVEKAYDQGANDMLEKVCEWLRMSVTIDKKVETNEDGEPLALSYCEYAMERAKAANEIVEQFRRDIAQM